MEMGQNNGRKRGRSAALIICSLLMVAVLFSAFMRVGSNSSATSGEMETLYRENTVEFGDITVGVTESATATLKVHTLTFDVQAEVEEIYVKAGQTVKEGDPVALMLSSSIQEQIADLQTEYQEAVAELSEAQLNRQKGELTAKTSYLNSLNQSEFADASYELTIEKLETALQKAKDNVEDIQTEIRTYNRLLKQIDNYDDSYADYLTSKAYYEDTVAWVESTKSLIKQHETEEGHTAGKNSSCPDCKRLYDNYESAMEELDYAQLEYKDAASDYNDKYANMSDEDEITEARKDARERLKDAEAAVKEAEYNLEAQSSSASLSLEQTMEQAELAELTYEMELLQLENKVKGKNAVVERLAEQIAELQESLANNLLTAPCDGVVTGVSYEAGDTVNANSTIASISDSSSVYVYVSITQDDIANISLGQSATLTMDAFDELAFDGEVDSISTTPARSASGSASYNVTIRALGDTAQIYEGMTGSVTLITRQQKDVPYISYRAIYERDGASYVKTKDEQGNIVETPIETGFSDGRNVEIVSGLTRGQTYIIESQVVANQ